MKVEKQSFLRVTILLAIMAAVIAIVGASGLLLSTQVSASAPNAPLAAPAAAPLPSTTCSLVGAARICDLWAREGSLALPGGGSVPIWGFTDTATGTAQLPGPPIIATQNETVTVILHNEMMSETVALMMFGQDIMPDMIGAAPGMTATYTFVAAEPGTFRYEAGLTPNGGRQVAMGMYGALIVRPAINPTGQAYDHPLTATVSTAYDREALLVLSEIDPAFQADPNGFDMTHFRPSYWLINGRAYSQTEKIEAAPGETVLLRYVNAGIQEHTLGVLGLHQTVLSEDGQPYRYFKNYVMRTMGGGQTSDALVTIPATAVINTQYAIFNGGSQQLHNNGSGSFGGILTFLETTSGAPRPVGGPLASNLSVAPNPVTANAPVTLTADFDSTATSGLNVTEWEYFINSIGPDGTGISMTVGAPAPATAVATTVPTSALSLVPAGDVTFYIHGKDANGTWGPVNSVILDLIADGPVIAGVSLNSSPANGEQPVGIQATGDATVVGDTDVVAAEYFIDTLGADGSGITMTLSALAPISSLTSEIPTTTIQSLTEGVHTIYIHALDALGNWGKYEKVAFVVDKTGPDAIGLTLAPSPNNGTLSVNSSSTGVLLEVNLSDASIIETAEAFIDYTNPISNPNGTGFSLIASDAVYDSNNERAYFIIPLTTVRFLTEGAHTIAFHGKDVAGNWGDFGLMTLVIDKTGPVMQSLTADPEEIVKRGRRTPDLTLTAIAEDVGAVANIVAAEWFMDTDPGIGQGNPMLPTDGAFDSPTEDVNVVISGLDIRRWSVGEHALFMRSKDAAGNWGDAKEIKVTIRRRNGQANVLFDDAFETADFAGWDTVVGAVEANAAAATEGALGMAATLDSGPAYLEALILDDQNLTGYRVAFDFNPNGADTAGEEVEIFTAKDEAGKGIFGIFFEKGPDGPEVQAWALQSGGVMTMTEGIHIADDVANRLELTWESGDVVELRLAIDGEVQAALTDLDTSLYTLDAADLRLGPSTEVTTNGSGTIYIDAFEIGPNEFTFYFPLFFNGGN